MILLIVLALILIGLIVITAVGISTFGAGAVIIFADVIVCIAIIVAIIRRILNR